MSFFSELKRRKIFQVAATYAVVAWLIIQITNVIEEPLSLPGWTDTLVIVILGIGFPIALILCWAGSFSSADITAPAGELSGAPTGRQPATATLVIQVLVLAAVLLLIADRYFFGSGDNPASASRPVAADTPQTTGRFSYLLPDGLQLRNLLANILALSPDGSRVVIATTSGLYLRPVSDWRGDLLPGTASAYWPTFSSDGNRVAYFDSETRQIMAVTLDEAKNFFQSREHTASM